MEKPNIYSHLEKCRKVWSSCETFNQQLVASRYLHLSQKWLRNYYTYKHPALQEIVFMHFHKPKNRNYTNE